METMLLFLSSGIKGWYQRPLFPIYNNRAFIPNITCLIYEVPVLFKDGVTSIVVHIALVCYATTAGSQICPTTHDQRLPLVRDDRDLEILWVLANSDVRHQNAAIYKKQCKYGHERAKVPCLLSQLKRVHKY